MAASGLPLPSQACPPLPPRLLHTMARAFAERRPRSARSIIIFSQTGARPATREPTGASTSQATAEACSLLAHAIAFAHCTCRAHIHELRSRDASKSSLFIQTSSAGAHFVLCLRALSAIFLCGVFSYLSTMLRLRGSIKKTGHFTCIYAYS